jgi:hypothetical protein
VRKPVTATYVESGASCNDDNGTIRCAVGFCVDKGNFKCPTVLADGAPCVVSDFTKTCAPGASCIDGVCRSELACAP